MRSWVPKVALLLVSGAIAVFFLELGWRVYLFGPHAFSYERMNSVRYIGVAGVLQRSPEEEVVFELKPDLDTYHKLVPLRTNAAGLRDRDYPLAKPEGSFRVAVLGDSYTMPVGVAIEDAYHSVLERRLNADSDSTRYEFVNFAVAGYSLRQYLAVMRHKALPYQADLYLVGFCGRNDHVLHAEKIYHEPYRPKEVHDPFFRLTFLEHVRRAFHYRVVANLRNMQGAPTQSRGEQVRYMRSVFSEMASVTRREGAGLLVVLLDTRPSEIRKDLERVLAELGIDFLDASKPFLGTDPDDYAIYKIDEHPNAKAHAIIADQILAHMRERALLPAPPSS